MKLKFHARCALLGHDPRWVSSRWDGKYPTHEHNICRYCEKVFEERELSAMMRLCLGLAYDKLAESWKQSNSALLGLTSPGRVESGPIRVPVRYKDAPKSEDEA